MNTYDVYILRCADNSYYTGVTNNIERRLAEHQEGIDINSYTYNRRPVQVVFCESFISPNEAIELEKQIKGWSRKKKEALIAKDWNKLKDLAKCKNQTSHKYFKNG